MQPAQQCGPARLALQVVDVPAVLAVHGAAHAGEPRGQERVEAGQVARVHDRRSEAAAEIVEVASHPPEAHPRTMERDHLHPGTVRRSRNDE